MVVCEFLPPATKLGQGYVFTRVSDSVHRRGGGSAPLHTWIHPLSGQEAGTPGTRPPQTDTLPEQTHLPWEQTPTTPGQTPPRSRPPSAVHAGRYGQQAGGTHPTGMQSCF